MPIWSAATGQQGTLGKEAITVAAADLGSNSFHMLVARVSDSGLQVIDRLREPVRLASGLQSDKTLSAEAHQRAMECLQRFGQRLSDIPADRVRIVGTNTLRRLRKSRAFLAEAERQLGHRVEIIAGVEEARLIYGGVAHGAKADGRQRLVVDIGGGSTELIIGGDDGPILMRSVHMGCVSWTQQFFADGEITARRMRAARLQSRAALKYLARDYKSQAWDLAIGASGSVRAVWKVGVAMGMDEHVITRESIRVIEEACIAAKHIGALELPGLREDRKPVLVGSLSVLAGVFDSLGLEKMEVSDRALREGVIYDLLGRLSDQDVRERSVRVLAGRFKLDTEHAARVETVALSLLEQVADSWKLADADCSDFLRWAARLHEVGIAISHSGYHKHSAYVLGQVDMHGFSRSDQHILAAIARGHRGKWSQRWFKDLPKDWRKPAQRLAILLRIAVMLNRGRNVSQQPRIVAHADKWQLSLALPEAWLDKHALTRTDLEQDALRLQDAGFTLKFS
ncbi:MAG: Ppx/GppA phosphatase family protein [Oceanococcus sp.]